MKNKRAYKRTSVKKLDLEALYDQALLCGPSVAVGLDIAKHEIVASVRWREGHFERPWSVKNPSEIENLIGILKRLRTVCDGLTVGLESTGNYGEAVRRALTSASIDVHRISTKATHDYQEVFDGVPSQHDGKDAAIIAELTAFGKGKPWPYQADSPAMQSIKHQVLRMDAFQKQRTQWLGRLEGLLAAHWPELTSLLQLDGAALLQLLARWGSPAEVARDSQAAHLLSQWGGAKLTEQKIEAVIRSAGHTHGVPMSVSQITWMQEVAQEALSASRQVQACKRKLKSLVSQEPSMQRHAESVGAATLAVIWTMAGDPRDYDSSGAFLKALGLNLKERSSGLYQGQLSLSKRGSPRARRWIYYWALRAVQKDEVKRWYQAYAPPNKCRVSDGRKLRGVVAVMRKLCRSLWRACQDEAPFDYAQVIDASQQPAHPGKTRRRRRRRRGQVDGMSRDKGPRSPQRVEKGSTIDG